MADIGPSLAESIRDRYALERELGRGGMATVYLAEDRKHGRKVAIKVLHPELSAVLGGDRFLAEIKLTASLQHPHILGLLDSGAAEGLLYYVMPHVAGESLRQRLDRERQLPVGEALRLAAEVADALDYAHRRGVIHRDIKPENILLQGGHALVADFGIALAVEEAAGSRMTQTGLSLGTPQYMSPEQAAGERNLTPRSDVYALGAVTYELLTGDPPFTAGTAQGVLARVLTEEPKPPGSLRRSVPPHVDRAVLIALEKLPADRFPGAAEFARALTEPSLAVKPGRTGATATLPLAMMGGVAVFALAMGYLLGRRNLPAAGPESPAEVRRLSLVLPDTALLAVGTGRPAIALSPDGSRLLYVARLHGENVVVARDLGSDSVTVLPGSVGATGPVASPSGTMAGFFVGWDLVAAPLAGGKARLFEVVTPVTRGAAWLTDSTMGVATDPNGRIVEIPFRKPLTRENIVQLTGDPGMPPVSHAWPEPLPGGKALLYAITDGADPNTWRIAARPIPDGEERVLIEGGSHPRYASSGHIVYLREDALWAVPFDPERLELRGSPALVQRGVLTEADGIAHYALASDGTLVYAAGGGWRPSRRLAWVAPDGSSDALPIADGMYEGVALAPDGRRIAIVRVDGSNHDIWLGDPIRGALVPLTRHGGEDGAPVWSPDGRRLAFATERWGGPPKLAIADLARGGLRLAVDSGFRFSAPSGWSPDGRRLFFVAGAVPVGPSETGSDIAVLDGADEGFWLQTTGDEGAAMPSPDGRWVAYGADETGRWEVYLRSAAGGGEVVPVSIGGGVEPRWGRSGRTLYFRRGDRILAVDVTPDDSVSPKLSTPRPFVQLPPAFVTEAGFNAAMWDIAPDERRVLGIEDRRHLEVGTLQVILGWDAVLRRLAPGEK